MLFHHFLNSSNCKWWIVRYAPTQPSFLDILTFFRLISWSPWLGWGSCPTAAQWGGDGLSLSSTLRLCREVVFSLCSVASSSLWISALQGDWHDPNSSPVLPKEVCEFMRTRKFCGTEWTNICWELLRFHWSSHDMSAHWRPIVTQTMPSEVPFRFHFLRFPDTWIKIDSFVLIAPQKTRVTLKGIRPKVVSSNWIYTAVLLWSPKVVPTLSQSLLLENQVQSLRISDN